MWLSCHSMLASPSDPFFIPTSLDSTQDKKLQMSQIFYFVD